MRERKLQILRQRFAFVKVKDGARAWTFCELQILERALETLSEDEIEWLRRACLVIRREIAFENGAGGRCINHTSEPTVIEIADGGTGRHVILHELGHALDYQGVRAAVQALNVAEGELSALKRSGCSSGSSSSDHQRDVDDLRFEVEFELAMARKAGLDHADGPRPRRALAKWVKDFGIEAPTQVSRGGPAELYAEAFALHKRGLLKDSDLERFFAENRHLPQRRSR